MSYKYLMLSKQVLIGLRECSITLAVQVEPDDVTHMNQHTQVYSGSIECYVSILLSVARLYNLD